MITKLTLSAAMGVALLAVAALVGLAGGHDAQAGNGAPELTLTPATATNLVGTDHTVTATTANLPQGETVEFQVTAGPNIGATFTCTVNADCSTDGSNQVSGTYTSNGTAGTDTIEACINQLQPTALGFIPICDTATKEWGEPSPTPTVTADPSPSPTQADVSDIEDLSGFNLGSDPGGGSGFPWTVPALLLGLGGLTVLTAGMLLRKRPR